MRLAGAAAAAAASSSSSSPVPASPRVVVESDQTSQTSGCPSRASIDEDEDVPITDIYFVSILFFLFPSPELKKQPVKKPIAPLLKTNKEVPRPSRVLVEMTHTFHPIHSIP